MNAKQLGIVAVLVAILLMVQVAQSFRTKASALDAEVAKVAKEEKSLRTQLQAEQEVFGELKDQSDELIAFVEKWEPFFAIIEEQQSAETGISMKVREAEMLNLSQRYQQIPHKISGKLNKSLPILMRATLVFDDDYSKLLNWIGTMEKIRPTMRIGRLALAKGSRGEDLRMDLVLEVPLRDKSKSGTKK